MVFTDIGCVSDIQSVLGHPKVNVEGAKGRSVVVCLAACLQSEANGGRGVHVTGQQAWGLLPEENARRKAHVLRRN